MVLYRLYTLSSLVYKHGIPAAGGKQVGSDIINYQPLSVFSPALIPPRLAVVYIYRLASWSRGYILQQAGIPPIYRRLMQHTNLAAGVIPTEGHHCMVLAVMKRGHQRAWPHGLLARY